MRKMLSQMIRFGLVGVVNTLTAYAVFALCLWFGVHYALATLIGGLSGMIIGFRLTGRFVFRNTDSRRWVRFTLVFAMMYALNLWVQTLLRPHVNPYVAGAFATLVSFLISFFLNRCFVFRHHVCQRSRSLQ